MKLPRFRASITLQTVNLRFEIWHEAGPGYFVGHVTIGPLILMLWTGEAL